MTTPSIKPLSKGSISHLFIMVQDLPRMLTFYRDVLGFEVKYAEEGVCAFLELGEHGLRIALYAGRRAPAGRSNHWFIVVDVDDLDMTVSRLREAGVQIGETQDVPYGRAATFSDPEGNVVEIHEPAKNA